MKFTPLLSLALLTILPLAGQAVIGEQTYHLAKENQDFPVGKSFLVKEKMTATDARLVVSFSGKEIAGKMNLAEVKDRVISYPGKDEVRYSFTEMRSKTAVKLDEMPGSETDKLKAISGMDVLLKKKEGKWIAEIEKGEVPAENEDEIKMDLVTLERSLNENNDAKLYGTEARKVGDKWDADPRLLPGMGEFEMNGGELSLLFKEVKEYGGEPCAIIEMTFQLEGISMDPEQKGMEATFTGNARVVRSLADFTDLKRVTETKFQLAGKTNPAAPQSPMLEVQGDMKMEMRMSKAPQKE